MYKFHYDYIKSKYGNNSRLLFTDTNSLMYEIKTGDFYEDSSKDKEILDFSNYPGKSKCYNDSSKLVVGKIKDETAGVAIDEFAELKPKIYKLLVYDSSEHKKAKGVSKNIVATISHIEYKDFLLNNKCFRQLMKRIQSKNHRIESTKKS